MEHNIRHGSIIYGGGDVLVPMMYEQYITRPTAKIIKKRNPDVLTLKKSELMAGAGIIRLMPGPVFSLVSFTAPLMLNEYNLPKKTFATLLATLSIYLPGILIILILFPIWEKVTVSFTHLDFLKGIYLSVSSLIFASCLYLTFDLVRNSVDYSLLICQLIMGTAIYIALSKYHINHAFIAIFCLSVGILFHYL
jgi:chromate transporter